MTHTDPHKRHDFVVLFDVRDGNPNGDPDADNLPRFDAETMHGLVTDVAIKRKVRDYAQLYRDQPIFIQSQVALNTLIVEAFKGAGVDLSETTVDEELARWFAAREIDGVAIDDQTLTFAGESMREADIRTALTAGLDDDDEASIRAKLPAVAKALAKSAKGIRTKDRDSVRDRLCRTYYDIRMFGAVLSTGPNAGQVRGPLQLTFARSIDPIFSQGFTITRQARTTTARMATGSTEIARKANVPYGLYRAHGFFNPTFAERTFVTAEDLALFWDALANMLDLDRAAARGEMAMRGVYIFTHENPLGNAPAHRLFERIRVMRREANKVPRAFEDYTVLADPSPLPDGITLTALVS